jgi:transcriptional regulator with XRE-family HTH domain
MQTTKSIKSQAKLLRSHFATHNIELTHSQCLEAVAVSLGFKNWRTAEALLPSDAPVADESSGSLDAIQSVALGEAIRPNVEIAFRVTGVPWTPGSRIATARLSLGYTQRELSAITGIPLVNVKQLESDRSDPRSSDLIAMLKAGIRPMWVIAGESPMLTSTGQDATAKTGEADKPKLASSIRAQCDALLGLLEKNPSLFTDFPDRGKRLVDELSGIGRSLES